MKEIRQIIERYESTDFDKEKIAIATVVNVEESSYRRIGARMLVSSSGHWIGGISGGCLEGDALRRSQKAIYNEASSRVVYDTMDDDANQIGVGLGCNGRLEVLFTPIIPDDDNNPIEKLKKIKEKDSPSVLITIIDVVTSEDLLGKSVIASELQGDFLGISKDQIQELIGETLSKKRSQIFELTGAQEEPLKVLFEFIRPEMKLIVIGDNYDVSALVGIVAELGWDIYIVGRKKKIPKSTFAKAKGVLEYEEYHQLNIDEYTSVLLMSHDYNWDMHILRQVLEQKPSYLGMLGPKKRMIKMQGEEGLAGLSEVHFLHSPIGLDIGAETPEEIAISILAEILSVFRNRDGSQLKYRPGTIHERHR